MSEVGNISTLLSGDEASLVRVNQSEVGGCLLGKVMLFGVLFLSLDLLPRTLWNVLQDQFTFCCVLT